MSNGHLVTIAIPTYNRADTFLSNVIQCALRQSWENIEVIVSDNASQDSTAAVVNEISDSRLKYIRHDNNIGANGNFNFLLDKARGEWFLLLHDDDLIDPDFISECMRIAITDENLAFVRTGVRAIDGGGNTLKERPNTLIGNSREDFFRSWFRSKTGFYLCNTLYHTGRLREIGGFHSVHNLLEDNFALVKLLEHWEHGNITAVKASYRYTYDQRTYQVPVAEWCEDFSQLLEMIVDQCSPADQSAIRIEARRFFGQLCVRRANAISSPTRKAQARLVVARHFGLRTLRLAWSNFI